MAHVYRSLALGFAVSLQACRPGAPPVAAAIADPRVLRLEELSFPDIERLDRQKTVFVVAFGNLEEHGPHLPVGSDYYQVTGLRDSVIAQMRRRHADYTFVLVPIVPLGEGGFNDFARQFEHAGTFGIRFATLRDVAIDLGAAIARQGFKDIWLMHFHGSGPHNVAFTEAAGFVSERYRTRMTNLTSLVFGQGLYSATVLAKYLGTNWERELGMTGHADAAETATNLVLRGNFVKPDYTSLPPFVVSDLNALGRLYSRDGFRGYIGAPAKATVALGQELMADFVDRHVAIAERALAGEDLSKLPRFPDIFLPLGPELDSTSKLVDAKYSERTKEINDWLARRTKP